jgi:hypothetical protein
MCAAMRLQVWDLVGRMSGGGVVLCRWAERGFCQGEWDGLHGVSLRVREVPLGSVKESNVRFEALWAIAAVFNGFRNGVRVGRRRED